MLEVIIAIVVTFAIASLLVWKLATAYRIKVYEAKIGSAEEKARKS